MDGNSVNITEEEWMRIQQMVQYLLMFCHWHGSALNFAVGHIVQNVSGFQYLLFLLSFLAYSKVLSSKSFVLL